MWELGKETIDKRATETNLTLKILSSQIKSSHLKTSIYFENVLLLDKQSYWPQIGPIFMSLNNSFKWDQSDCHSFIRLGAVLFQSWL